MTGDEPPPPGPGPLGAAEPEPGALLAPVPALAGARVLIVDDVAVVAVATARVLGAFGCRAATAGSLAEASRLVGEGPWDLVVLDLELGRDDGRTLLADPRLASTAVLVVSGHPREDVEPLGRAGYLGKPWTIDRLLARVEESLSVRRSERPDRT